MQTNPDRSVLRIETEWEVCDARTAPVSVYRLAICRDGELWKLIQVHKSKPTPPSGQDSWPWNMLFANRNRALVRSQAALVLKVLRTAPVIVRRVRYPTRTP